MRLLNAFTYELEEFLDKKKRPKYAILSHRWSEDHEIKYGTQNASELRNLNFQGQALDKIRGTCSQAKKDELDWVWIDSFCIDKASSEELSRSLRSMFAWYSEADVCYTYLVDVAASEDGTGSFKKTGSDERSQWFERDWTLQELLAPQKLQCFDTNWKLIGTRNDLAKEIQDITGIDVSYLDGSDKFKNASIATRLSWQARRKTLYEEDLAYSLFAILDVDIDPRYGEKSRAFIRLQQEILRTTRDESLFAWTAASQHIPLHDRSWKSGEWGLLAPCVHCFENSHDYEYQLMRSRPIGSILPVQEGARFPLKPRRIEQFWWTYTCTILPVILLFFWNSWTAKNILRTASVLRILRGLGAGTQLFRNRLGLVSRQREFKLTLNCVKKSKGNWAPIQIFVCQEDKSTELWKRCRSDELGRQSPVTLLRDMVLFSIEKTVFPWCTWLMGQPDVTFVQPRLGNYTTRECLQEKSRI